VSQAEEGLADMKIKKILFPTDFSDCSLNALEYAVYLAKKCKACMQLLYVDEAVYLLSPLNTYAEMDLKDLSENFKKMAEARMDELVQKFIPTDVSVGKLILIGRPYSEIIDAAKKVQADMIVMGTHGRSGLNIMMGSNAERVVRQSPCPVITVRQKREFHGFQRILVPVDFSKLCKSAVPEIVDFVRIFGSELLILYVAMENLNESDELIKNHFEKCFADMDITGVIYRSVIERARVNESDGILASAIKNGVDLIAMGTHGRTGLKRFMTGSVTEEVVNTSAIPVMSLRSCK
jgi:nucleotide-binding universal stress UspA family protein